MRLLLFTIDDRRFGIGAANVSEIVRAVAITPLPGAPTVIEGVIDVRGEIVPVFDLRRRFGLPARDIATTDQFVLTRSGRRTAALHVDRASDLVDVDAGRITPTAVATTAHPAIAGVATLPDGLALISDVDAFLSQAEAETLDAALAVR